MHCAAALDLCAGAARTASASMHGSVACTSAESAYCTLPRSKTSCGRTWSVKRGMLSLKRPSKPSLPRKRAPKRLVVTCSGSGSGLGLGLGLG